MKEKNGYIYVLMGCKKLTYYESQSPLKVVYRKNEPQQKVAQRFITVDPMTFKHPDYTPYAFCYNNPVLYIDPLGLDTLLPDVSGNNFYLPDPVENIQHFSGGTVKGEESGNEYSVYEGGVKSFTIGDITYSASFNKGTGEFSGYKGGGGETYNQFDHLPSFLKENYQIGTADLLSFSANLESTFIRGTNASWQINILFAGDNPSLFYTRSEAYTKGFGVDWGINILEAWYHGAKSLSNVTSQDVAGKFTYWQGNLVFGLGKYKGYNSTGDVIWKGNMIGFGFGFGGSYGEGRTILKD